MSTEHASYRHPWLISSDPTVSPLTDGDSYEGISPLMLAKSKEVNDGFDLDMEASKHYRPHHHAKRIVKRFSHVSSPIFHPTHRNGSSAGGSSSECTLPLRPAESDSFSRPQSTTSHRSHRSHRSHMTALAEEVTAWLRDEKAKKKARKVKRKAEKKHEKDPKLPPRFHDLSRSPSATSSSSGSLDLERLESILEKGMRSRSSVDLSTSQLPAYGSSALNLRRLGSRSYRGPRRPSILRPNEVEEEDVLVPSCAVVLDNSKTLAYSGGGAKLNVDGADDQAPSKSSTRAWAHFKLEIVRLSHTLKLKGWRQVPMSQSGEIHVERLSGALTNAVYVVAPPDQINLPADQPHRKAPVKLLLRIYGSQTDQLIDREAELNILERLSKKHIGPRMLATFANGRFEEFLHAQTLKPQDLRVPETSKQIAKRMRELHDGVELLDGERESGPFVWSKWDRCVERAEKRMEILDKSPTDGKGLICGTSWTMFRRTVEHYREQLWREYGGAERLNDQLVFAHNDTQYGNILRLEPPGESPLLLPANVHKQLVVIDFEYANANVPGLEFANHFTEWCYNYHDPAISHVCNTHHYPTPEEQTRFVRAYVAHQPGHAPAAPTTPRFTPLHHNGSFTSLTLEKSASYHYLDKPTASYFPDVDAARRPDTAAETGAEAEAQRVKERESEEHENHCEEEVQRLLRETQLWRIANSAQWVVWGILQASIPGVSDEHDEDQEEKDQKVQSDPLDAEAEKAKDDLQNNRPEEPEDEPEAEFDYLAYSRERALFFWGDCLQMGLVREEDLGTEVAKAVKIVPY